MKDRYIIPIFVPHNGCPNQCVFCNQNKISGQCTDVTGTDVKNEIEQYLSKNTDVDYTKIEVAFYGGSFTGIQISQQNELLEVAKQFIDAKRITGIRISTRPDYIDQKILDRLKFYGVKTIELGVQSMNDLVLDRSLRGHSSEVVKVASKWIKENGFKLGLQMMVGLPQSNEEIELETAKQFVEIKPSIVRIYPVLVVKDTPLADQYINGEYKPYSLERAVEISAKLLNIFRDNDITVIRMGLQATDNIDFDKDVVAGPFHPAFGELVEQYIIYLKIKEYCLKNINVKKLSILCNPKDVSKITGNKRENIIKIKNEFNIDIRVKSKMDIEVEKYIFKSEE